MMRFFKRTSGFGVLMLFLSGAVLRAETAPIVARQGWSFDRAQFRDDATAVEKARQAGPDLSLTGWAEYDFASPSDGWYELWIAGIPEAWSRDVLIDDKPTLWFATSSRNGDFDPSRKGWMKEANLFLTAGPHRLKFRRLAHPGRLPSAWELRAAQGPASTLRVIDAGANVVRVTDEVTLKVLGGGPAAASYELLARNEEGGELTSLGSLSFPAAERPVERTIGFRFPKQGVYEIVAKAGGEMLRPADLKAGEFIVVDTQAPAATEELRTTPIVDIDCTATPKAGEFWELEGPTTVVEKPLGKYRESSGRGLLGRGWGSSGFSYRFQLPDIDHIYRIRVDYPDDERRSMGFWVNDGSDTRANHLGVVNTGGVETGDRFPLTQRMLTHEAYFYPRGNQQMVIAVLNLVPGMKAAAARIRIDRVDGGLPAAPAGERNGRTMGYYTEESGRWLRFFGGTETNVQLEQLKTLERWGQWNRYIGANLIFPTINVYQANHYPSRILEGYFNTPINQARLAALEAEKYGSEFVPEFHLSGQTWFDRYVMGVWVEGEGKPEVRTASPEAEARLIRDKDGKFNYSLPFTYNVLHPDVQEMYIKVFGELADTLADTKSFAGISSRIMMSWVWEGWNVLPGLEFGYDDWTVGAFEKETGKRVAVDPASPDKYRQRFQILTGPLRQEWIDWRCRRVFAFHQRLLARIQKAKPSARLFFTWFGPDKRKSFSDDLLERMREAGMDWRMYRNEPGIVIIPTVGYGRRYSTPLADTDQAEPLYDAGYQEIGRLPGRAFGFFSEYFEMNHLLDWSLLGGKPYAAFDAAVPSGVNERELYAIALANCDSNFLLNGGNGWIFGTPEIMQPFLREYRALPAKPFEPWAAAQDPVAVWQYRDEQGRLWFYAVNRLAEAVKVKLGVKGRGFVQAADGEAVATPGGDLAFSLEPFMLRAFRADRGSSLETASVEVPTGLTEALGREVAQGLDLAAGIRERRIAPEMTEGEAAEAVQDLEAAKQAFDRGEYWRAKVQLQRMPVVRAAYLSGRFIPNVWERSTPHGVATAEGKEKVVTVWQNPKIGSDIRTIAYDENGDLWLGGEGRVVMINSRGELRERAVFQPYGYDPGDVRHPVLPPSLPMQVDRLAALGDGRLAAQQGTMPPVIVAAASGRLIGTDMGRSVNVATKACRISGDAPMGNLLVMDDANQQVVAYDRTGRFLQKLSDKPATTVAQNGRGETFLTGADGTRVLDAYGREKAVISALKAKKLVAAADSSLLLALSESGREISGWKEKAGGYEAAWTIPLPQPADDFSVSRTGKLAVLFRQPVDGTRLRSYQLTGQGLDAGTPLAKEGDAPEWSLPRRSPLKVYEGALYFLTGSKIMKLTPGSPDRLETAFDRFPADKQGVNIAAFAFAANGDLILAADQVDKNRELRLYRCAKTAGGWGDPEQLNEGRALVSGQGFEIGDLAVDADGAVVFPLPDKTEPANAVSLFRWKPGHDPERLEPLGSGQAGYFLAAGRNGGLLLTNASGPSLARWDAQGQKQWTQRRAKASPPGSADLRAPGGIAEDRNGGLWITDQTRHQIVRLDESGKPERALGSFGTSEVADRLALNRPTGLAILVDAKGAEWMYVADSGNGRLLKMPVPKL